MCPLIFLNVNNDKTVQNTFRHLDNLHLTPLKTSVKLSTRKTMVNVKSKVTGTKLPEK